VNCRAIFSGSFGTSNSCEFVYEIHLICVYDPWFGFQCTHPPLLKRILKIDPQFDGAFPKIHSLPSREAAYDLRYEESVQRMRAEVAAKEGQE